jgi:hypothetical protein
MSQYVTKSPCAIPSGIEKAVVPADDRTDHIPVGRLREVEDSRNLRANRRLPRREDRLLTTEQAVQDVAPRASLVADQPLVIGPRDGRELNEWGRHSTSR